MDIDLALYEGPLDDVKNALREDDPLLSEQYIQAKAELIITRLVNEDWLRATQCEYRNGPRTVDCENLAPMGRSLCYIHSNY